MKNKGITYFSDLIVIYHLDFKIKKIPRAFKKLYKLQIDKIMRDCNQE